MRYSALVGVLVLLTGCRPGGDAAQTPELTAADLAGTWDVQATEPGSDSVLVQYQLNATTDLTGWTTMLPNRDPGPLRVQIAGDSVVLETDQYESVLRPGTMVSTRTVARLMEGRLVGVTVARYQTAAADSVTELRIEGTRRP